MKVKQITAKTTLCHPYPCSEHKNVRASRTSWWSTVVAGLSPASCVLRCMHTFNFKMDQRASLQHEDMIEKEAERKGRNCSLEHLQFVELGSCKAVLAGPAGIINTQRYRYSAVLRVQRHGRWAVEFGCVCLVRNHLNLCFYFVV